MANAVKLALDEYDMASVPELKAELSRLSDVEAATIDLSSVTYMDSSCIGLIAGAAERFHDAGNKLRLVNVPSRLRFVFAIAGLGHFLDEA